MANILLEKYKNKLTLAESVHAKTHNGEPMDSIKKITVAKTLDNVTKFLNESVDSSMGTQRSALGDYKKFCLALTVVGVPQLIAFDLVTVSPMSSMYGNIAFLQYTKGTNKGQSAQGDLVNSVHQLGDVDSNYTGSAVVETVDGTETNISALGFTPQAGTLKANTGTDGAWADVTVASDGSITLTGATKVRYLYDNVTLPQETLPTLKAELTNIGLEARARRITIHYSQMAAFQAKTDYGFDLADGLAEQATAEIAYETDTEIIEMLYSNAPTSSTIANFSKTQPTGVSLADHYAAFAAKLEEYKMAIYEETKKFSPTAMVVAPDVMPLIQFVPGFTNASTGSVNGPYFAGTVSGLKVFVSPAIESGEFFLVVNQNALEASAGVYAPYMPIVPTTLLGLPDGGQAQGFSTLYDAKILNPILLIKGAIED